MHWWCAAGVKVKAHINFCCCYWCHNWRAPTPQTSRHFIDRHWHIARSVSQSGLWAVNGDAAAIVVVVVVALQFTINSAKVIAVQAELCALALLNAHNCTSALVPGTLWHSHNHYSTGTHAHTGTQCVNHSGQQYSSGKHKAKPTLPDQLLNSKLRSLPLPKAVAGKKIDILARLYSKEAKKESRTKKRAKSALKKKKACSSRLVPMPIGSFPSESGCL